MREITEIIEARINVDLSALNKATRNRMAGRGLKRK